MKCRRSPIAAALLSLAASAAGCDCGLHPVSEEGSPDAAPAVPTDGGRWDSGISPDVGTLPDGGGPDAALPDAGGADGGCGPQPCQIYCAHGFRKDHDGCDVCLCRDCDTAADCEALGCQKAVCVDGLCTCECAANEIETYVCPGGEQVQRCGCSAAGYGCVPHPEYQCPTLCHPEQTAPWSCPDGSMVDWCTCKAPLCSPECRFGGTPSEGWYDSCLGVALLLGPCSGCTAYCGAIGTKSEGWLSSCGGLIEFQTCAPAFTCADSPWLGCASTQCTNGSTSTYTCPDGAKVPFCDCRPPDAACPPVCAASDAIPQGWYNACTSALVKQETCGPCLATCEHVGTRSEGWYSSCSGLIAYSLCGTGAWNCASEPWKVCQGAQPCIPEGSGFPGVGVCCPGLTPIGEALWDGKGCLFPNCLCYDCTVCGDGRCTPPENPCNCAKDCFDLEPRAMGEPCGGDAWCQQGLTCIQSGGTGVCSRT